MDNNLTQEQQLLHAAAQLESEEQRKAFLDAACAEDPKRRARLEELLKSLSDANQFFSGDPLRQAGVNMETEQSVPRPSDTPLSEGPGATIGRYKLLQKIGEGGMGLVYMAEQTEPVIRKVALKIIKLGMDTRQVIARFEAERQALALMDHPNIAHVLDGGSTDSGRPYFVMELVTGVPITDYCDKNKLSTKERIELFVPVCQAIQSAHQKGIIHRDVKPSNVLVTLHQGDPAPKVIDFGIAKATNQKLTEKTLFTNYATMIGTPAYMSPEQAEMDSMDVDSRTDVYSLGVLLYELLTGTTPISEKRLRSAGYGEIQRIITGEEPEKPSTRMSSLVDEQKTAVGQSRGMDASVLQRKFQGDVDWITMRCLEKDRRRRYETPSELAADLKRHLNNEPVSAAAPSLAYQFHKFRRKHKVLVRSAMIVSAVLIATTAVSITLALLMNQFRKDANNAKQAALDNSIELENNLYVSDMLAVEQAVANEEIGRAQDLLNRHRSEPSGNDLRGFEWRYYHERSKGDQIEEFQAHAGPIHELRLSPDGQFVLTVGKDNKTKLWHRSPHQLLHEWPTGKVAVSPDWRRLATAESDGKARLWELPSAIQLHVWKTHPGAVRSLNFSHDSHFLTAIVQPDPDSFTAGEVAVWNVDSKELHWSLSGKWWRIAISPTEPIVATHGWARDKPEPFDTASPSQPGIQLWNYETKEALGGPLKREERDDLGVSDMLFSPTGQFLASGLPIHIWKVSTRKLITSLPQKTSFSTFSFSADDVFVATKGRSRNSVQVWETATGRLAGTVSHEGSVTEALFQPLSGDNLITCSTDQTLRVWKWKESQLITRQLGQGSDIISMAADPEGLIALSGGKNGTVMTWRLETSPSKDKIPNGFTTIPPVFSSKGRWMVIAEFIGQGNITTRDLSVPAYLPPGPRDVPPPLFRPEIPWRKVVYSPSDCNRLWVVDVSEQILGFTPDEEMLLTISPKQVVYRNAQSGDLIRSINLDPPIANRNFNTWGPNRWFALSPDGTQLAAVEDYKRIRQIDLSSGDTIASMGESALVTEVQFNPAGDKILFRSRSIVGIWEPDRDKVHRLIKDASWEFLDMDVAPDNQTAITSCSDDALRVWQMQSGELIHTIRGLRNLATQVSFSADSETLAVLHSSSPFVRLWNTRTWRIIAGLNYDTRPLGVRFSPDDRSLITSHFPTGVKLWRAPWFKEIEEPPPIQPSQ